LDAGIISDPQHNHQALSAEDPAEQSRSDLTIPFPKHQFYLFDPAAGDLLSWHIMDINDK
ncbi:hypothetical protein, partial [Paraburkholderia sp. UYCP14C]|uniref:hypothetical protein n=1 Tax=Paraburkholderia sp. UYCP14C TaxID=2511130 RepID=UPI001B7D5C56